ncbi:hypothetical protein ACFFK0_18795 [Paenibacillus chartarius]|uniref:DUF559 domain-containing protein n=1 Tax=Paenibacillus chartarius TaxID=747481 RepID=A0ABV6DPA7_9BACL
MSMVNFEAAHAAWLDEHLARRTGERRGRLERGYQHAERLFVKQIWWPLVGSLNNLHPEYEVTDWRGRSYFADFVWLIGWVKLVFEIKGYAAHVRDMDRYKYCNELNRETFLFSMGLPVISFAYDDIEQRPDTCIALLRMVMARYQPHQAPVSRALLSEKELLRLAIQLARPIRPVDVVHHLQVDSKTAVVMLRKLCDKGWLTPAFRGRGERIVCYELVRHVIAYLD